MEAHFLPDDLVRLHVIADSDQAEAQRVKLCVVKAIRARAARLAARSRDANQAFELLAKNKNALRRAARREARRQRFFGPVAVKLGVFAFPDRTYAGRFVPAGDYKAVRVVLGEGAGRNWWCVVYPSLCAVEEACAQALTSPEAVTFYSSIGRFFEHLFKGAGV